MFGKTIAAMLAGAVLVTGTVPAKAQEDPKMYVRSGQWQLEAGDADCRLARNFTNGDETISLALERNEADPLVRLILVSDALHTFRGAQELGYRLAPVGEVRAARYLEAMMDSGQAYYNLGMVRLSAPDPLPASDAVPPEGPPPPGTPPPPYDRAAEQAFAAQVTAIELTAGFTHPVRLETGSMRAAVQALQACTDDLLLTWGLDYQAHQTMTRRATPVGNVWDWARQALSAPVDPVALSGARNRFRVMIDAQGLPTACQVEWPSLSPDRNTAICAALMANGRFEPALDANGQPMASYWTVALAVPPRL